MNSVGRAARDLMYVVLYGLVTVMGLAAIFLLFLYGLYLLAGAGAD